MKSITKPKVANKLLSMIATGEYLEYANGSKASISYEMNEINDLSDLQKFADILGKLSKQNIISNCIPSISSCSFEKGNVPSSIHIYMNIDIKTLLQLKKIANKG